MKELISKVEKEGRNDFIKKKLISLIFSSNHMSGKKAVFRVSE